MKLFTVMLCPDPDPILPLSRLSMLQVPLIRWSVVSSPGLQGSDMYRASQNIPLQ